MKVKVGEENFRIYYINNNNYLASAILTCDKPDNARVSTVANFWWKYYTTIQQGTYQNLVFGVLKGFFLLLPNVILRNIFALHVTTNLILKKSSKLWENFTLIGKQLSQKKYFFLNKFFFLYLDFFFNISSNTFFYIFITSSFYFFFFL